MYGMVNRAIQDLVTERFGAPTWDAIKTRAGVTLEAFVPMEGYEDGVTYGLVAAASEETGIPAHDLLAAFGEYWILYTARQGYGDLLRLGGNSFSEFLSNLHNLHSHVALGFPHLQPPSFWLSDRTETGARLHYQSSRPGLAPMVLGLLAGLGRMFDTPVTVEHAVRREDGADHDEFLVHFGAGV